MSWVASDKGGGDPPSATKDLDQITDEEFLKTLWQQAEDFGDRRRIRARMYKLREKRLREMMQNDEESLGALTMAEEAGDSSYESTRKESSTSRKGGLTTQRKSSVEMKMVLKSDSPDSSTKVEERTMRGVDLRREGRRRSDEEIIDDRIREVSKGRGTRYRQALSQYEDSRGDSEIISKSTFSVQSDALRGDSYTSMKHKEVRDSTSPVRGAFDRKALTEESRLISDEEITTRSEVGSRKNSRGEKTSLRNAATKRETESKNLTQTRKSPIDQTKSKVTTTRKANGSQREPLFTPAKQSYNKTSRVQDDKRSTLKNTKSSTPTRAKADKPVKSDYHKLDSYINDIDDSDEVIKEEEEEATDEQGNTVKMIIQTRRKKDGREIISRRVARSFKIVEKESDIDEILVGNPDHEVLRRNIEEKEEKDGSKIKIITETRRRPDGIEYTTKNVLKTSKIFDYDHPEDIAYSASDLLISSEESTETDEQGIVIRTITEVRRKKDGTEYTTKKVYKTSKVDTTITPSDDDEIIDTKVTEEKQSDGTVIKVTIEKRRTKDGQEYTHRQVYKSRKMTLSGIDVLEGVPSVDTNDEIVNRKEKDEIDENQSKIKVVTETRRRKDGSTYSFDYVLRNYKGTESDIDKMPVTSTTSNINVSEDDKLLKEEVKEDVQEDGTIIRTIIERRRAKDGTEYLRHRIMNIPKLPEPKLVVGSLDDELLEGSVKENILEDGTRCKAVTERRRSSVTGVQYTLRRVSRVFQHQPHILPSTDEILDENVTEEEAGNGVLVKTVIRRYQRPDGSVYTTHDVQKVYKNPVSVNLEATDDDELVDRSYDERETNDGFVIKTIVETRCRSDGTHYTVERMEKVSKLGDDVQVSYKGNSITSGSPGDTVISSEEHEEPLDNNTVVKTIVEVRRRRDGTEYTNKTTIKSTQVLIPEHETSYVIIKADDKNEENDSALFPSLDDEIVYVRKKKDVDEKGNPINVVIETRKSKTTGEKYNITKRVHTTDVVMTEEGEKVLSRKVSPKKATPVKSKPDAKEDILGRRPSSQRTKFVSSPSKENVRSPVNRTKRVEEPKTKPFESSVTTHSKEPLKRSVGNDKKSPRKPYESTVKDVKKPRDTVDSKKSPPSSSPPSSGSPKDSRNASPEAKKPGKRFDSFSDRRSTPVKDNCPKFTSPKTESIPRRDTDLNGRKPFDKKLQPSKSSSPSMRTDPVPTKDGSSSRPSGSRSSPTQEPSSVSRTKSVPLTSRNKLTDEFKKPEPVKPKVEKPSESKENFRCSRSVDSKKDVSSIKIQEVDDKVKSSVPKKKEQSSPDSLYPDSREPIVTMPQTPVTEGLKDTSESSTWLIEDVSVVPESAPQKPRKTGPDSPKPAQGGAPNRKEKPIRDFPRKLSSEKSEEISDKTYIESVKKYSETEDSKYSVPSSVLSQIVPDNEVSTYGKTPENPVQDSWYSKRPVYDKPKGENVPKNDTLTNKKNLVPVVEPLVVSKHIHPLGSDSEDEEIESRSTTETSDKELHSTRLVMSAVKRTETSPGRSETSPRRLETSPRRTETSPQRSETSPQRSETSPRRSETSPRRTVPEKESPSTRDDVYRKFSSEKDDVMTPLRDRSMSPFSKESTPISRSKEGSPSRFMREDSPGRFVTGKPIDHGANSTKIKRLERSNSNKKIIYEDLEVDSDKLPSYLRDIEYLTDIPALEKLLEKAKTYEERRIIRSHIRTLKRTESNITQTSTPAPYKRFVDSTTPSRPSPTASPVLTRKTAMTSTSLVSNVTSDRFPRREPTTQRKPSDSQRPKGFTGVRDEKPYTRKPLEDQKTKPERKISPDHAPSYRTTDQPASPRGVSSGDTTRYRKVSPEDTTRYRKPSPEGTTMYQRTSPDDTTRYRKPSPEGTTMYRRTSPDDTTRYRKKSPEDTTRYRDSPLDDTSRYRKTSPEGSTGRRKISPDDRRYRKTSPEDVRPYKKTSSDSVRYTKETSESITESRKTLTDSTKYRKTSSDEPVNRRKISPDEPFSRRKISPDEPVSRRKTSPDEPVSRRKPSTDEPVSRRKPSTDEPVSRRKVSPDDTDRYRKTSDEKVGPKRKPLDHSRNEPELPESTYRKVSDDTTVYRKKSDGLTQSRKLSSESTKSKKRSVEESSKVSTTLSHTVSSHTRESDVTVSDVVKHPRRGSKPEEVNEPKRKNSGPKSVRRTSGEFKLTREVSDKQETSSRDTRDSRKVVRKSSTDKITPQRVPSDKAMVKETSSTNSEMPSTKNVSRTFEKTTTGTRTEVSYSSPRGTTKGKDQRLAATTKVEQTNVDKIISPYGVGPTDENGVPLFGLKALKRRGQQKPSDYEEPTPKPVEKKDFEPTDSQGRPLFGIRAIKKAPVEKSTLTATQVAKDRIEVNNGLQTATVTTETTHLRSSFVSQPSTHTTEVVSSTNHTENVVDASDRTSCSSSDDEQPELTHFSSARPTINKLPLTSEQNSEFKSVLHEREAVHIPVAEVTSPSLVKSIDDSLRRKQSASDSETEIDERHVNLKDIIKLHESKVVTESKEVDSRPKPKKILRSTFERTTEQEESRPHRTWDLETDLTERSQVMGNIIAKHETLTKQDSFKSERKLAGILKKTSVTSQVTEVTKSDSELEDDSLDEDESTRTPSPRMKPSTRSVRENETVDSRDKPIVRKTSYTEIKLSKPVDEYQVEKNRSSAVELGSNTARSSMQVSSRGALEADFPESEARSFLDDRTKVSGIADVISRMGASEAVDHEAKVTSDDQARSLLNKFLGAQVMMTGVESMLANSPGPSGDGKITVTRNMSGEQSTKTVTGGNVFESKSSFSTGPQTVICSTTASASPKVEADIVKGVNINEVTDDFELNQLLDSCEEYDERRRVRLRLKALMAEQKELQKQLKSHERGEYSSSRKTAGVSGAKGSNLRSSEGKTPFGSSRGFSQGGSQDFSDPKQVHGNQGPPISGPLFQLSTNLSRSASGVKDMIMTWCQCRTRSYKGVNIENFSTSWNDGMAFCALIHHFYPDAFDFNSLNPKNRRQNFALAFRVADERAGVMALLDVDDMVMMKKPDWKCVFTYVQSLYRRLKDE